MGVGCSLFRCSARGRRVGRAPLISAQAPRDADVVRLGSRGNDQHHRSDDIRPCQAGGLPDAQFACLHTAVQAARLNQRPSLRDDASAVGLAASELLRSAPTSLRYSIWTQSSSDGKLRHRTRPAALKRSRTEKNQLIQLWTSWLGI